MKKKLSILLVLFCISVFPQEQNYFTDVPFGGGGGYFAGWVVPKTDVYNNLLKQTNYPQLTTSGFFTSGGGGFFYLTFIPGLRVGGIGYGGSTNEKIFKNNIGYESRINMGGGGLTVDYTLPFIRNVAVSVGFIAGAGATSVELFKNRGSMNWSDLFEDPEAIGIRNLKIENTYVLFTPTLTVDFSINQFMVIHLQGGYQLPIFDSWEADNGAEINNVPSDLDNNSFILQLGLMVGLFSF